MFSSRLNKFRKTNHYFSIRQNSILTFNYFTSSFVQICPKMASKRSMRQLLSKRATRNESPEESDTELLHQIPDQLVSTQKSDDGHRDATCVQWRPASCSLPLWTPCHMSRKDGQIMGKNSWFLTPHTRSQHGIQLLTIPRR